MPNEISLYLVHIFERKKKFEEKKELNIFEAFFMSDNFYRIIEDKYSIMVINLITESPEI